MSHDKYSSVWGYNGHNGVEPTREDLTQEQREALDREFPHPCYLKEQALRDMAAENLNKSNKVKELPTNPATEQAALKQRYERTLLDSLEKVREAERLADHWKTKYLTLKHSIQYALDHDDKN